MKGAVQIVVPTNMVTPRERRQRGRFYRLSVVSFKF